MEWHWTEVYPIGFWHTVKHSWLVDCSIQKICPWSFLLLLSLLLKTPKKAWKFSTKYSIEPKAKFIFTPEGNDHCLLWILKTDSSSSTFAYQAVSQHLIIIHPQSVEFFNLVFKSLFQSFSLVSDFLKF